MRHGPRLFGAVAATVAAASCAMPWMVVGLAVLPGTTGDGAIAFAGFAGAALLLWFGAGMWPLWTAAILSAGGAFVVVAIYGRMGDDLMPAVLVALTAGGIAAAGAAQAGYEEIGIRRQEPKHAPPRPEAGGNRLDPIG